MISTIEVYGKEFNVEKRGKEWQTNYRDAKATTGDTKVDAIEALKVMDKGKLLSACDSHDNMLTRDAYFKAHTEEFRQIFGFIPPRDLLLYDVGMGLSLDVIALDKKLRTPDGILTKD